MKNCFYYILIVTILISCSNRNELGEQLNEQLWTTRLANLSEIDSLAERSTYLSIYSHIASISENRVHNLTITDGMRNTSRTDRVFVKKADYYNTEEKLIKAYLERPIYIQPMETVEIMVFEEDETGGIGGNFIFDWSTLNKNNVPHFEAVMVSTAG